MIISVHRPKPFKPRSPTQFGYFLAGLIDSDGHFSKIPQLVICFHEKEKHVPYYLKKEIGYGVVSKIRKKRANTFVVAHLLGLEKVCKLVHNKLRHKDKIDQYNTRLALLTHSKCKNVFLHQTGEGEKEFSIGENHWFAGFFMGDGSFQIKMLSRKRGIRGDEKPEVRLVVQIDQKTNHLLLDIKKEFGGNIGFRSSQNTFYYSSTSFLAAERLIKYFDRFHLMGTKLTQYVLWRKVFLKIRGQNYSHTPLALKWIASVKKRMSLLSS
jgi:hypothetical protein